MNCKSLRPQPWSKILPEPLRRIIGDLSNTERVLAGLNLTP